MTKRSLVALLLAVIMCLPLVGCGGTGTNTTATTAAGTTGTPAATSAPDDTTADVTTAEVTTAEATTVEETTAKDVIEYGENGYGKLDSAEQTKLINLMPALLPDGSLISTIARPFCGDDTPYEGGTGYKMYNITGNSQASASLVGTDGGAIYGTAFKFGACGSSNTSRGEITVEFWNDDDNIFNNPKGAKGILFYVDFSRVDAQTGDNAKVPAASVTINTNDYRGNMSDSGSKGYYYLDGAWIETKNVNACRMEIPNKFVGWIYIPATSFCHSSDKTKTIAENGVFPDITIKNMRCYTDGYVYTDDPNAFIIFDEITFIY